MLRFWPVDCRKRQSTVLCLHTPFPQKYKVSFGVPNLLLRMTEYFVRNITRVCLPKSNSKIYILSLRYSVQRTIFHCERSVAIFRKGNLVIKTKTINAILSAFTNFRTWSTPLFINTSLLKSNKRELIKISIQFVCKLQSIIILYTKVNRSLFPYHMHLYLYLLKHTYYIW